VEGFLASSGSGKAQVYGHVLQHTTALGGEKLTQTTEQQEIFSRRQDLLQLQKLSLMLHRLLPLCQTGVVAPAARVVGPTGF
jgi:hypothetical protein